MSPDDRNILFPSDAGVIDVTKAPYLARGDGFTDCTRAIQRALDDHPSQGAIIYLPQGVYVVSDTLRWPDAPEDRRQRYTTMQGQSRVKTILRVPPRCPGFTDRHNPRAALWTGDAPAQRFRNQVHDLCIEIGEGNAGGIGMQFMANNQGGIYNVDVRSMDGDAAIAIDMAYSDEIGPLLIKNVRVFGFAVGVKLRYWVDSVVMEHVHLEGQKECGISNDGQCLSVRGLTSVNDVTAVTNLYGASMLTIVDSELRGAGSAAAARPALLNEAALFARNVKVSGYGLAIDDREGRRRVGGSTTQVIDEYTSHEVQTLFATKKRSLNLPVLETPDVPWDPFDQWASPTHFGYVPGSGADASIAIQKAIDSGATTVYLPRGEYRMDATAVIRGKVRRVIGCEGFIDFPKNFGPAFLIADGDAPVVVFERIYGTPAQQCWLESRTSRTIVIRYTSDICEMHYGPGDIFLDDVVANPYTPWEFHGKRVWARQFNVEQRGIPHCVNDGGTLWILGYKLESGGSRLVTCNGGASEVLGGFIYSQAQDNSAPAFVSDESRMSVTIGEACFNNRPITALVEEIRNGERRRLEYGQARYRANGSMMVLFAGGE